MILKGKERSMAIGLTKNYREAAEALLRTMKDGTSQEGGNDF
jgi:hypothetical protein